MGNVLYFYRISDLIIQQKKKKKKKKKKKTKKMTETYSLLRWWM